jgi:hypothetical protein
LKLGPLDTDWAQYEDRVRLENIYVRQSVKQVLPARDLTRDYLRLLHARRGGETERYLRNLLKWGTSRFLLSRRRQS